MYRDAGGIAARDLFSEEYASSALVYSGKLNKNKKCRGVGLASTDSKWEPVNETGESGIP